MKLNRTMISLLMLGLGMSLVVFSGCGKKGFPQAPQKKGYNIAAPFDVKAIIKGDETVISWNHRIDSTHAVVPPEGFEVFMAKKLIDACEGCPIVFEKIKIVPMPKTRIMVRTPEGVTYYFRVQATGQDDLRSEYSKTVQVDRK